MFLLIRSPKILLYTLGICHNITKCQRKKSPCRFYLCDAFVRDGRLCDLHEFMHVAQFDGIMYVNPTNEMNLANVIWTQ